MQDITFPLQGGLDLTTPKTSRAQVPGKALALSNYVVTEAGYERVSGYTRWDGAPMARLRYALGPYRMPLDSSNAETGAWAFEGSVRSWSVGVQPRITRLSVHSFVMEEDQTAPRNVSLLLRRLAGGGVDRLSLVLPATSTAPAGWIHMTPTGAPREDSGVFHIPVDTLATSPRGPSPPGPGGLLEVNLDPSESAIPAAQSPTSDPAGVVPGIGPVLGIIPAGSKVYAIRAGYDARERIILKLWRTADAGRGWVEVEEAFADIPFIPGDLSCAAPEHRVRYVQHAFGGGFESSRIYLTAGWMPPFELNPADDSLALIETSTPDDVYADFIAAHNDRLWLGYARGSVLYSSIGAPTSFRSDAGFDGGEIAVGDQVTGLVSGYRGRLFILSRSEINVLSGRTEASFELDTLAEDSGAYTDTAVVLDEIVAYDDRGLRAISATDAAGDFTVDTLSRRVQPYLTSLREAGSTPVAAVRIREASQYRLYFSNGSVLVLSHVMRDSREGPYRSQEFSSLVYIFPPDIVESMEDEAGNEKVLLSLCDRALHGTLHIDGVGDDFDRFPIAAVMELAYNDLGASRVSKRWRKIVVYGASVSPVALHLDTQLDDGRIVLPNPTGHVLSSSDARWNVARWGEFVWNLGEISNAERRISGRGRNLALTTYADPTHARNPHTLESVSLMFLPGRQER